MVADTKRLCFIFFIVFKGLIFGNKISVKESDNYFPVEVNQREQGKKSNT